jgi:hypothetical protein
VLAFVALAVAGAWAGCILPDEKPSEAPPSAVAADGGGEGGAQSSADTAPPTVTLTGTIVDLFTKGPVASATVQAGTPTTTTGANGIYSLAVDPSTPFNMTVTKTGYYRLLEQETIIPATIDRGLTSFLSETAAQTLQAVLEGFDLTKGVVSVAIETGTCPSEDGATIDWTPHADGGAAVLRYFKDKLPDPTATHAQAGQFPHAILYNLDPGVAITLTVTPPAGSGCRAQAFPVDAQGIRYTSAKISPPGGKALGFLRLFLTKA